VSHLKQNLQKERQVIFTVSKYKTRASRFFLMFCTTDNQAVVGNIQTLEQSRKSGLQQYK